MASPGNLSRRSTAPVIGVISDTHGLVRPQVLEALTGAELIIHAGDIGNANVLKTLETIAPVHAVRGNNDRGPWAGHLPLTAVVIHRSCLLYVLHELDHLDVDPVTAEISAVIFGHSHRPFTERRKGVLYLNPGSAGPRRFTLPVAVARLHMTDMGLTPELIEIEMGSGNGIRGVPMGFRG